jgi:hypothetical protein
VQACFIILCLLCTLGATGASAIKLPSAPPAHEHLLALKIADHEPPAVPEQTAEQRGEQLHASILVLALIDERAEIELHDVDGELLRQPADQ